MRRFLCSALAVCTTLLVMLVILAVYLETRNPEVVDNIPVPVETIVTEPTEAPETMEMTEYTEPAPVETTNPTEVPETTEVAETEFVSYYPYTEEELDLLARLLESEGGTESYNTKLKIASIVMNRVEDPDFPNTIYEVIYQTDPTVQFSVIATRINGVLMIDRPASEESYKAAKEVLDYGSVLPSTVQVFYAVYCNEPWVTSRATYEISDNTVFAHIYGG